MMDLGKIVVAVIIGLVLGVLLTAGVLTLRNRETMVPITIVPPAPTATDLPTTTPAPIQVFVSGEVLVPDVYALEPGSRIKQLVEAAGGFTDKVDLAAINLAQPLTDGAHVHIQAEGELNPTPPNVLSSPVPQRGSTEIEVGTGGGLVDINTAVLNELETLPGIGPVRAQTIIDYRTVNGPFHDIAAIMEVHGIGQGTFDNIKELITTGK
jgi:competence protein ComEA